EPVPYNTTPSDVEDRPATASTARMERAAPVSDLTNEDVRQAQTTLADMGFYEGEIDGLYGPRSIAAVGEFQTQQNMPRTLALDDRTQQALRTRSAQGGSGGAKDARQAASGSGAGQAGTAQTSPAGTGGEGGMAA